MSKPPTYHQPTTNLPPAKEVPIDPLTGEKEDSLEFRFQEIWAKYPRPLGKKQSLRHFLASVTTPAQWSLIQKALDNYKLDIKRRDLPIDLIQHGSTWFNNWQDWVHYNPKGILAPVPPTYKPEPPPEPDMTPEEMKSIREVNMKKIEDETVPVPEINALIQKLAGGIRRIP